MGLRDQGIQTRLIHADRADRARTGGSAPTLERSSTFLLGDPAQAALASGEALRETDVYGRFGTSTTRVAGALVAELEAAEAGLVLASGMAAIHSTLTAMVPAGGRAAVSADVYGGTHSVATIDLVERGVDVRRFDATDPESLAAVLVDAAPVHAVWCESISNPLIKVTPIRALAELCRAYGSRLLVDATFASGMAHRPLELGADAVVHSATKYLNGHSDVIAGVVCGSSELVDTVFKVAKRVGGCADPMAAWLLARGLRTLPLRWRRQCETAQKLARALAEHPAVLRVHHPSLDPGALAHGSLESAGAMLSYELESGERASACLGAFELAAHAPSLGGTETLVCSPRQTSHTQLTAAEARDLGITDGLVRVSVGLEDFEDLWTDFQQAIESASSSSA